MPETRRFKNTGADFSGYYACTAWLDERGYVYAEMQRKAPIGVHRESEVSFIGKWRDLAADDKAGLDGRITWDGDARHGTAVLTLVRPIEQAP